MIYRKDASAYTSLPYSLLGLTRLWNYRWEGLGSNHRGLGKSGKFCKERTGLIAGIKPLCRRTDCDRTIRIYKPRAVGTNRISSVFATYQGHLYHTFEILCLIKKQHSDRHRSRTSSLALSSSRASLAHYAGNPAIPSFPKDGPFPTLVLHDQISTTRSTESPRIKLCSFHRGRSLESPKLGNAL